LLTLWGLVLGAIGYLASHDASSLSLVVLASFLGALSVLIVVEWRWLFPLRQLVCACREIEKGHLDVIAPELGAPEVKATARIINDMAADFQEVLLMTAHGSNAIRRSAESLDFELGNESSTSIPRKTLSEMLELIRQINELIQEFKYFRVVVGKDSILDVGILKATDSSTERPSKGTIGTVGLDMACVPGSRRTGE